MSRRIDLVEEAKRASKAECHLYVWACVTEILEGSTNPDRQDHKAAKSVNAVLAIAHKERDRLLKIYDTHMDRIAGDAA